MPNGKITKFTLQELLLDCDSLNTKYFANTSNDSATILNNALTALNNETMATAQAIDCALNFLWKVYNKGSGVSTNCSAPGLPANTEFVGRLIQALDETKLDTAMQAYGNYDPCSCYGYCDCQGAWQSCPTDGCASQGGGCDSECTCYGILNTCDEEGIHNPGDQCDGIYNGCASEVMPYEYYCAWFHCVHFYWTTAPSLLSLNCEIAFSCETYGFECWVELCNATYGGTCTCDGNQIAC